MKNISSTILIVLLTIIFISCEMDSSQNLDIANKEVSYPETRKDTSIVEDYHGTAIADPYRWLEDDHSEETKGWVKAQNQVTNKYLDHIPFRDDIKTRLTGLWNYEKYSSPFKRGDKYYFFKNDGLQNQSVMYGLDELNGEPSLVLDPNKLSDDGTSSLGSISFNHDGRYLAYQVSEGGSDWRKVKIKDLKTGKHLEEELDWLKFTGMSWAGDGFFYSRYPTPENDAGELTQTNEFHKVYYHRLGEPQSKDKVVIENPDKANRNFYAQTTDDERFLIVAEAESTSGNALKVKDLGKNNAPFVSLSEGFDNDFNVIDNIGDKLLVMTNKGAPNFKIVTVDMNRPSESNWVDFIPEASERLRSAQLIGGKLMVSYIKDAKSLVKVYDQNGAFLNDLDLPGIGTVSGFSGKKDENIAFYSFTSFTSPSSIYKLDTDTGKSELFRKSAIDFDAEKYESKQVFFESYDGTKVPMFLTYKKGLKLDGQRPTLLYGYGGFDISILPSFSLTKTILLENDGIYAVVNLRGGGEYGSEWHKAGTKERKQNVFDDFQSAAEYLIDNKYTSSEKLAIEGGSNGGLLVGACMTQRPDLYKVAFPRVGVLDMLRYHKFTIGRAWASDYGTSESAEDFEYLIKYSPLHNVKEQAYPATMVMTADHDDRVVPAHSFKYISELQSKENGASPTLIRIETDAGHGAGKPTDKQIQEATDMISFMFFQMGEEINY